MAAPSSFYLPWPSLLIRPASCGAYWHRHRIGGFGDAIHLSIALAFCFCLGCPMFTLDLTSIILVGCLAVRCFFIRGSIAIAFTQFHVLAAFALFAWQACSIAWSHDRSAAIDQWGGMRFILIIVALFPILHYRALLSFAVALGFAVGVLVQVASVLGTYYNIPSLTWAPPTSDGRFGGWWTPVIAGELLAGAFALHLGAAAWVLAYGPRPRLLALPTLGAAISLAGLLISGTRAAWIVAAALIPLAFLVPLLVHLRNPGKRRLSLRWPLIALATLLVTITTVTLVFRGQLTSRLSDARNELSRAKAGELDTNTGLRIAMAGWAWQAFTQAPLTGVGVGDFREWVLAQKTAANPPPSPAQLRAIERFDLEGHGHAHNTPLQALATVGAPGFILLAITIGLPLAIGLRRLLLPQPFSSGDVPIALLTPYANAPVFVITAMVLLMPFEVIHISAQCSALLFTAVALTPAWLASPRKA